MSKKSKGELPLQESNNCPSAFTLTFVIEVLDTIVWEDCKAGWLDLGSPANGVKLSYNLYPGQTFNVDVVICPHVAKVFCGTNYAWVRTWQFLERRWLTFSIRHSFPVRVADLRKYEMKLIPNFGIGALSANSKNMNIFKVYLPPPQFGERRQFAEVVEAETTLKKYIGDILWALVVDYIPASNLDGPFDTPYAVQDIRHQDAALYQVQNVILNCREKVEGGDKENIEAVPSVHQKGKRTSKEITKNQTVEKVNYEIKLSGDWVLAGIGRITPFVEIGNHPTGQEEVIALISSINLPAQDDFSIFFANVCNLYNVPIEHLKQNRFTHIYTRWTISDEEYNSEQKSLQSKQHRSDINFNDHHSVPLHSAVVSDVMATFLDDPFQLELRGIRVSPLVSKKRIFFGYNKADHVYDKRIPRDMTNQDVDILIAQTRIDARTLTKINGFIKGEFPLYPPETSVTSLNREGICTNDINAVRAKVKPNLIQAGVVLQAQMMIEVSLGLVGCQPKSGAERYSRLFCLVSNRDAIKALLFEIIEINESVMQSGSKAGLLTGFGLDLGDTVMLYIEGPRKGQILRFWEKTADLYPSVKPVFSTSAFYSCRLYPDLLQATMPFIIMKMVVPLSVLLGVTPVYTRPTLPLPARSALLKIGRLIASKLEGALYRRAMPTAMELKSFRLELCAPPRPPPVNDQSVPEGNMNSEKKI